MSKRDEYVEKIKAQIDDWNADITKVEERAAQASDEMKTKYEQCLDSLRAERAAAYQKIEQIIDASDDAWDEIQANADDLWERSKAAFAAAKREFED